MADTVPPVKLDNFVDILCNESYKEVGLSVKRILADIRIGNIETNLGESGVRDIISLGLQARLLTSKTGNVLLTDDGIRLSDILKERGKGTELWSYLHRCLQRIDIYREYLDYLSEPQKEKAAREFKEKKTTAKSMFRWLERMGMLIKNKIDKTVQYIPVEGEKQITNEEFLKTFEEVYEEKAKEAGPMWRGTFVEIRQLRDAECLRLKIDLNRFDELLRQLLLTGQLNRIKVRLAKGPRAAYANASKPVFEFNGEKFLYLALNEVKND